MRSVMVVLLCVAGTSAAEPAKEVESARAAVSSYLLHSDTPVRFAFHPQGALIEFGGGEGGHGAEYATQALRSVVGVAAAEPDVSWVAFDLAMFPDCFTLKGCKQKASRTDHVTVVQRVSDPSGGRAPLMWHAADPFTSGEQAKAGGKLEPLATKIDKGAEDAVKTFQGSIGDPKAFAASVSARADVVMFGSDAPERFVGGAAVKAQLAKWKLAFKVRDGIQAGVSPKGTVAWIAANVDAAPVGKPKAAATPYRVTAVYEKTAAAWQLVQLHFSFYVNPFAGM